MGRWQHTIYLLRPLAVKLMTRRGLTLAAILTYGLAVAFDPRPEPIVGDEPIRETLNLSPHLTTDEAQLSQAPDIYINWKEQAVASGDNLSRLFYRAGLNDLDVYRISNAKTG
jgi:cell envelope opacity-associated protein A